MMMIDIENIWRKRWIYISSSQVYEHTKELNEKYNQITEDYDFHLYMISKILLS
jgi:hypothetical protein